MGRNWREKAGRGGRTKRKVEVERVVWLIPGRGGGGNSKEVEKGVLGACVGGEGGELMFGDFASGYAAGRNCAIVSESFGRGWRIWFGWRNSRSVDPAL